MGIETDGSDGLVTGSPTNPSGAFPLVNPTVSVDSAGLTGSVPTPTHRDQILKTSSETFIKSPGSSGGEAETASNPSARQDAPRIDWPENAAWAARWQAKIDGGRRPDDQADAAWRALRAALRRVDLPDSALDQIWSTVAEQLIDFTNAAVSGRRLARTAVTRQPPQDRLPDTTAPHTVEDGIPIPKRSCGCDYCADFYRDLDA